MTTKKKPIRIRLMIEVGVMIAAGLICGFGFAGEVQIPKPQSVSIISVHAHRLPIETNATEPPLLLFGHLYALSLDPKTKLARWCCYRATEADAASRNVITRNWLHALPDLTLEEDDYRGPEYDIGHLAPLGTFKSSTYAFELNFMANCAPQTPSLNRGPWLKLEERVRRLTHDYRYVDVSVGTLYERPMPPLPNADEYHRVPSHYWATVTPQGEAPQCYIVDQLCNRSDELESFAVSIDELERRAKLTLTNPVR